MQFSDREEAAAQLARKLEHYRDEDMVVYALPRGGVVTGAVVAEVLDAPLEVVVVRKVGHPYQPEYAVCAVTADGTLFCNEEEKARVDADQLAAIIEEEKAEAARREEVYISEGETVSAQDKIVIVVDDGIATGLTMYAAVEALKKQQPKQLIVAVPVAPQDAIEKLKQVVDEVVTLNEGSMYKGSVGAYYDSFPQVEDETVIKLLQAAKVTEET